MPSWGEIQEYARGKWFLDNDEPDWFGLVWDYGNGRKQKILVKRFTAFDREWVEFRSAICQENEMSPKVALRKNSHFAVGAIALDDSGTYVFTYTCQLGTMDPEEFELPLHVIANTADGLEKEHAEAGDKY